MCVGVFFLCLFVCVYFLSGNVQRVDVNFVITRVMSTKSDARDLRVAYTLLFVITKLDSFYKLNNTCVNVLFNHHFYRL